MGSSIYFGALAKPTLTFSHGPSWAKKFSQSDSRRRRSPLPQSPLPFFFSSPTPNNESFEADSNGEYIDLAPSPLNPTRLIPESFYLALRPAVWGFAIPRLRLRRPQSVF